MKTGFFSKYTWGLPSQNGKTLKGILKSSSTGFPRQNLGQMTVYFDDFEFPKPQNEENTSNIEKSMAGSLHVRGGAGAGVKIEF